MAVKGQIKLKCIGCGKSIMRGKIVRGKKTGGYSYHPACWNNRKRGK